MRAFSALIAAGLWLVLALGCIRQGFDVGRDLSIEWLAYVDITADASAGW